MPSPSFESTGIVLAGTAAGLHASADGGRSWRPVLVGSRVMAVAFISDHVILVGTEQDGILRSDDGGQSWTSANPGLLDLTVLALTCSPTIETDHTVFAATASGLFWSRNTGRTWRSIDTLPGEPVVQCVALSPRFASDPVVLAGTEADGLFRSADGGIAWHSVAELMGRSVTALAWSSGSSALAATDTGLARSNDAGASWRWVGQELGPLLSVAVAADGGVLVALPGKGLMRSIDCVEWRSANDGLQANLIVALAIKSERTLYIAGLEDGIAVSHDAGATWQSANDGLSEDRPAVFGLATNAAGVFAATGAGVFKERAGSWRQVHPRAARAICADEWRVLAAGLSPELLASADAGSTWRVLELPPDLGQPTSVALGKPSTVIVGSELGVWRSTDGLAFQRLLAAQDAGLPVLAAAPTYAIDQTMFIGIGDRVMRLRRGDPQPLGEGACLPASVSVLATSPAFAQDRTVLAGTVRGTYISRDAAATFHEWREGLGDAPIVAVAFSPAYATDGDVYAVELGGRIWRRHDWPPG